MRKLLIGFVCLSLLGVVHARLGDTPDQNQDTQNNQGDAAPEQLNRSLTLGFTFNDWWWRWLKLLIRITHDFPPSKLEDGETASVRVRSPRVSKGFFMND